MQKAKFDYNKPCIVFIIITLGFFQNIITAQQLAFSNAEGFGKYTSGGRYGSLYHVTNLNDSGTGSLRDAVSKPNRIIVFDLGGVIKINTRLIINENITIAGQTAPGGGITVYGNGIAFSGNGNNIIRYIRFRMGKSGDNKKDTVGLSNTKVNIIFDHVSMSWGKDGTFDANGYNIDNITLQDCFIAQGINIDNHSTGGLIQCSKISIIRSLWIDNKTRNPKIRGTHEFINNVIYNWRTNGYIAGGTSGISEVNMLGNYFVYGPESIQDSHITRTTPSFNIYQKDNRIDTNKDGILNGEKLTNYYTATIQNTPYDYPGVNNLMSAKETVNFMVKNSGASIVRDEVDKLLINELLSFGTKGKIITTEDDNNISDGVGFVAKGKIKKDSDNDGMPDDFEDLMGFDKELKDHNLDKDNNGLTNIELYFEYLIIN
ncbi:pectate lyase family protein [Thalassobellus suaedae]|uniref:Pectate lyase C n=1 Tax=Thalassobellus suaedae TaxID=3074124 RepID=A0ABY9XXP6_9FLAO|nr:hypothetical protein RHP51_08845 [Flavobacteriaceae bacterium HL-DH14]